MFIELGPKRAAVHFAFSPNEFHLIAWLVVPVHLPAWFGNGLQTQSTRKLDMWQG